MKGDLHFTEQDSIYYGVKVPHSNVQWEIEDNFDDLVNPIGRIEDAFLNKEWIWIVKGVIWNLFNKQSLTLS